MVGEISVGLSTANHIKFQQKRLGGLIHGKTAYVRSDESRPKMDWVRFIYGRAGQCKYVNGMSENIWHAKV